MICRCCKLPIHKHQARPSAAIVVYQAGRKRTYETCGECAERLEATLGRRPRAEVQTPAAAGATR